MELKQGWMGASYLTGISFNRTSMELKLDDCGVAMLEWLTTFNRTSMELKHPYA